jgi:anhydro-N-acetylmuramic acid kinase
MARHRTYARGVSRSFDSLRGRLRDGSAVVAGVLSGTSGDGIDVALVRFDGERSGPLAAPRVLAFETRAFGAELGPRVRAVLDGAELSLRETALLDRDLGAAFGSAARELAREHGVELDLAGSHGQTVFHHDGDALSGRATLQLGDGDFVAEAAGCAVVSDFRQRDVAAGGEGAPISALADDLIFAGLPRPSAVLNLGGMANLTILGEREVRSFDTGPAGALLDGLARRLLDRPFDAGGARALLGTPHRALVDELLAHEFLRRAPPKSTGRDTFGEAWVDSVAARADELGVAKADDLLASAADFVALSVARALAEYAGEHVHWLVVCGGGVHHQRVMNTLALRCPSPVASGADFGVDPDAREALVFAVLAARCVLEIPTTRESATGAKSGRVLGKISLAATGDP